MYIYEYGEKQKQNVSIMPFGHYVYCVSVRTRVCACLFML